MPWTVAGLRRVFGEAFRIGSPRIFASLHEGDPGETGAMEKTGDNYSRIIVPEGGGFMIPSASSEGLFVPFVSSRMNFPPPSADYPNLISHVGFWDDTSLGTFFGGFPLRVPVSPESGKGLFFDREDLRFPVYSAY